MVIVEHSTQTVAPMHRLRWRDDRGGPQELICEALMISFSMVVRHEVGNRVLERGLPKKIIGHCHLLISIAIACKNSGIPRDLGVPHLEQQPQRPID